jgi:hypothetical protein
LVARWGDEKWFVVKMVDVLDVADVVMAVAASGEVAEVKVDAAAEVAEVKVIVDDVKIIDGDLEKALALQTVCRSLVSKNSEYRAQYLRGSDIICKVYGEAQRISQHASYIEFADSQRRAAMAAFRTPSKVLDKYMESCDSRSVPFALNLVALTRDFAACIKLLKAANTAMKDVEELVTIALEDLLAGY